MLRRRWISANFLQVQPHQNDNAMTKPVSDAAPFVHPHQIEVQEFSTYARVIDARSAAEYAEDHIPGAVNVPTTFDVDASTALDSGFNPVAAMPSALAAATAGSLPGDTVLVYCSKGGRAAVVWADLLRRQGHQVDVLPGGWASYRQWVSAGLDVLPRTLEFRRIWALPAMGIEQVVEALRDEGQQAIDIAAMSGVVHWPGVPTQRQGLVTQSAVESLLLDALRHQESDRAVWVAGCSTLPHKLTMPPAMRVALERASTVRLQVPTQVRAATWLERLVHAGTPCAIAIEEAMQFGKRPSRQQLAHWRRFVESHRTEDALVAVIDDYVDVVFAAGEQSLPGPVLALDSLDRARVRFVLSSWLAKAGCRQT